MTAIVMVDGIAYTRKEGVPCYDSGLGWRECQSDESHLAGALVDAQDELATLRAQLAGVRERQNSGKIWSHVRSALDRAGDVRVGAVTYEEESAKLDEIARTCESRILAPPPVDDRASRRAADLLISHFGGQSLEDAVEKAVAVRYMKREEGIIPPWEMLVPPAPARRTITREEFNAARVLFLDEDMTSSEVMTAVAAAWRLTVEDA